MNSKQSGILGALGALGLVLAVVLLVAAWANGGKSTTAEPTTTVVETSSKYGATQRNQVFQIRGKVTAPMTAEPGAECAAGSLSPNGVQAGSVVEVRLGSQVVHGTLRLGYESAGHCVYSYQTDALSWSESSYAVSLGGQRVLIAAAPDVQYVDIDALGSDYSAEGY